VQRKRAAAPRINAAGPQRCNPIGALAPKYADHIVAAMRLFAGWQQAEQRVGTVDDLQYAPIGGKRAASVIGNKPHGAPRIWRRANFDSGSMMQLAHAAVGCNDEIEWTKLLVGFAAQHAFAQRITSDPRRRNYLNTKMQRDAGLRLGRSDQRFEQNAAMQAQPVQRWINIGIAQIHNRTSVGALAQQAVDAGGTAFDLFEQTELRQHRLASWLQRDASANRPRLRNALKDRNPMPSARKQQCSRGSR
jgi:hypothetical protein